MCIRGFISLLEQIKGKFMISRTSRSLIIHYSYNLAYVVGYIHCLCKKYSLLVFKIIKIMKVFCFFFSASFFLNSLFLVNLLLFILLFYLLIWYYYFLYWFVNNYIFFIYPQQINVSTYFFSLLLYNLKKIIFWTVSSFSKNI